MTRTPTTNAPELTIRIATNEDAPTIFKFILELAEYEKLSHEVEATLDVLTDSLFIKKQAEVLLAEYRGQTVGFALFFHNFSTFLGKANLYLEDLYVMPDYRGLGIGKAFLSQLARIAVERGCGRLDWWCLDWNQASIGFYKSLGAKPMSDWTVYRLEGSALSDLAKKAKQ